MMSILSAVWRPRWRYLSTFLLLLTFMLWFSSYSYVNLQKDYHANLEESCDSITSCYITIFDSWYKADGALGGFLGDSSPSLQDNGAEKYKPDHYRVGFDFIFNMVIGVVLIEILAGIIIETFSAIREQEDELEERK
jgi:inositol 1,4,5-triphosphate receptor type 1